MFLINKIFTLKKRCLRLDFFKEFFIVIRYSLIGIIATAIHIFIVWLLLTQTHNKPIYANIFAFLIAFGVSFLGHYIWTFNKPRNLNQALLRFFIISISAFIMNTFLFAFLVQNEWFSHVTSAFFSASIVPIFSFIASRLWGFKG